jgi:hypothetical protein
MQTVHAWGARDHRMHVCSVGLRDGRRDAPAEAALHSRYQYWMVLVLVLGLIGTVDTGFLVLMQTGIQVHQYIVYTTHY